MQLRRCNLALKTSGPMKRTDVLEKKQCYNTDSLHKSIFSLNVNSCPRLTKDWVIEQCNYISDVPSSKDKPGSGSGSATPTQTPGSPSRGRNLFKN